MIKRLHCSGPPLHLVFKGLEPYGIPSACGGSTKVDHCCHVESAGRAGNTRIVCKLYQMVYFVESATSFEDACHRVLLKKLELESDPEENAFTAVLQYSLHSSCFCSGTPRTQI